MKIVSIFGGHDANITFADSDKNLYYVIEIERLTKKRYFRLHVDNTDDEIKNILLKCRDLAIAFGFDNDWDILVFVSDGLITLNLISSIFNYKSIRRYTHQLCHAASAYYQSGFEESHIISFDGGGDDGFFNIFNGDKSGICLLEKIECDFGGAYMLLASCITEITKWSSQQLSLPGKMMGLCAYGIPDKDKIGIVSDFFIDRDYKKLSELTEYNLKNVENPWGNSQRGCLDNFKFEDIESYNFAATAQFAFETKFLSIFENIRQKYNFRNLILTGGAALNVLLNQKIKDNYSAINLFLPPNPSDCGLSLGASFLASPPKSKIDITYSGLPIIDIDKKEELLKNRKTRDLNFDYVCSLLKQGKIIGICRDNSEVGPRALGNRSIICDPSLVNMKNILNSKVKFREWFRPFAPFCLKEEASKYFISRDFENFEFMSYAPIVRDEYKDRLPSITHVDGTARLQTVTEESHSFFYKLLVSFSKYSDVNVLLNTSFNIKGMPILSSIEDTLYVLDNTQLDCLIIQDTIVEK